LRTLLDRVSLAPAATAQLATGPAPASATTLTYTFDPLLTTDKDWVRAAIGDRDMTDPLRSDQEIDATIALDGDRLLATATLAEGLAAEYARRVDSFSESGGISVRWGERVRTWLALAAGIRASSAATGGTGAVEGIAVRLDGGVYVGEYARGCTPCGGTWFTE
jgi:hypothetical protein